MYKIKTTDGRVYTKRPDGWEMTRGHKGDKPRSGMKLKCISHEGVEFKLAEGGILLCPPVERIWNL